VRRLALFLTFIWTANNAFAQAESSIIGTWECVERQTVRDGTRTVGVFRKTGTLELHADQTVTGPAGGPSILGPAGRWSVDLNSAGRFSVDEKRVVLRFGDRTMSGSLVREKLLFGASGASNREVSTSTSWTCTKLPEAER
jgi:hypothetical protein